MNMNTMNTHENNTCMFPHHKPAGLVGAAEQTDRMTQALTLQVLRGLIVRLPPQRIPEVRWNKRRNKSQTL